MEDASYWTAAEMGAAASTTAATVVRLSQSLGFKNYGDLKQAMRQEKASGAIFPLDLMLQNCSKDSPGQIGIDSIRQDVGNINRLLDQDFLPRFEKAVTMIAQARRILVVAQGSHAGTALTLTHNLNFIGRPAVLENKGGSYLGQELSLLDSSDLIISVAFWHVQNEVVQAINIGRGRGIPTLAIADSHVSPTALAAEHYVLVSTEPVSFVRPQTAALSVIYAVLAAVAESDRERTIKAVSHTQDTWKKLGIFYNG